jgi:hypothetical protein
VGNAEPGFQKDEQGGEGSKPTNEEKGVLEQKPGPHTFVLIYL